ncbi:DUF397 domain-containing protein [Streptomyces sp. ZEA17I]|uniref:DUF397 domain-containing protein n=1 Tax=Streptomyces sp. ZEA17I TaxID=2202516 RepID=UPI000D6EBBF1|nr:DUF397 domain-containing protein [Streptomyces sp. ZEA17I]PWS40063.1 DUF397 domain-containing protein [Streptomyces sp. ZEA17I]
MTEQHPQWFTSSYSSNGGNCVEVAVNLAASRDTVQVRDSKSADGPVVGVRPASFSAFVGGVRAGAFGAV